ncbi:finTRIM family, member 54 [Triplophysa dalaica]|uniref:finTRIM family, member 54 n=1 Tax=Triplophysa dalaica TaxID=1582913 RepID=UPI0024DFEB66|nr:finTRIM family, member 54 [Triplophysa dalaica]
MAESRLSVSQDQLTCSICLDLLNDPVTIPSGHSFCMSCISRSWDQDNWNTLYRCPQCRQTFTPRPALNKNVVIAQMVANLNRTQRQTNDVSPCYADFGDVECDVCTSVRKRKAVKSCLVCLNSFCQSHLQQHESLFEGERHYLMDAVEKLEEMICPKHDKLLEAYCHTDKESICSLCMRDEHKQHDVAPVARIMTQSSSSLSVPHGSTDFLSANVGSCPNVRKSFSKKLKKKIDNFLNLEMVAVSGQIICYKNNITDGPKNRNQILQYLHVLSMDSNTNNEILHLSDGNRVAGNTDRVQQYPDHPERFDSWPQVLCKESVCGRCYWEVEWSGDLGVEISVSYKSISRKGWGEECKFGCNDQSWSLHCSPSKFTFCANNKEIKLNVNYRPSRIGVYVDYNAGTVQFFKISDKMKLIYMFQIKCSQPLFPGFRIYFGSAVKLCDPARNCG